MRKCHIIVQEAVNQMENAARIALDALVSSRIEQEPAFTDRLLGGIEHAMDGFRHEGIIWTAKTFTDRGHKSQESRIGADFAGVLKLDLARVSLSTGFLAQAKLVDPRDSLSKKEYQRLVSQCRFMLHISPASYVFLYSVSGIQIVPAISLTNAKQRNPYLLYKMTFSQFFEYHLASFIGDYRLGIPSIEAIKNLRTDSIAQRVLFLSATSSKSRSK
ncbi:MAG: hypothetical protein GTO45_13750 [Candidatus Aminicenantes bacterium]|nr:hypothetical protein [Candidatus Aminicenantes bacterium]NIM79837.1 hypothetical protein [Candidatus Aminicenantes bacterium]NIN19168.1 hypothetical protein [Candidatus Aminicenantes bacterium]NIN43072.1 hypothetical protein [Candidatus Aminicenantes bacterium]NIN85813.1 hypothetical protein [Candidatus Aminicenantes bacterium]